MGDIMYYVYKIENKLNGKSYIGITCDIKRRLRQHLWALRNNRHSNSKLQRAFNKYGENNFSMSVIEEIDCDFDYIARREIYFISVFDSCNNGYNLTYGGDGTDFRSVSDETKKKQSEAMLGNSYSLGCTRAEETKEKMSKAMKKCSDMEDRKKRSSILLKSLWQTEWFREKMAELNRGNRYAVGRKVSEEQKELLSKQRIGSKNPFFNHKHTNETREKLSSISKNRWEDKDYVNLVNKNRNIAMRTDEYRKKQSELSRGRSKKTTEFDAITIRYRYLCGESPNAIICDFPLLSLSGLKKICYCSSWKHLPNTKEELYTMIINYQTQK